MDQVSKHKKSKGENLKGMEYLITEIVRKASDYLVNKRKYLCQRAHKKENNNYFLNEVSGKLKNKIYSR